MTTLGLQHRPGTKTIQDLVNLYEDGQLNLEPGFQRQSVWNERDRAKLIESILRNYPLPAIFLYRNQKDGQIIYDVIDGKQRLESILMFIGKIRGRFRTKAQLLGDESVDWVTYNRLCKRKMQLLITGYEIPVIEVDGEFGDIIDVFVRINSTGKALTPQEKRHAKYYNSRFLKEAARLANKYERYFSDMGVLGSAQISRMKHVELISELALSIHQGHVINKKTALDRIMAASDFDMRQINKAFRTTTRALNRVRRMFPKLYMTRFAQVTDFYTLTVLIAKFEEEGLILTDSRRNRLAWDLLTVFSTRIDEMRGRLKKAENVGTGQELYRQYLLTVMQATDEVNQRRYREQILRGILENLFSRKDSKRGFSTEQRRIIWNTTLDRRCRRCNKPVTWEDFTVDHINPHSKGGLGIARDLETSDLHVEVIDLLGNRVEAEIGVAFFVASYSALRKVPVSPALLVLGDMSVQGNIKPLRSLTEPLQVAKDNGAKRALIPIENKRNFLDVSADIMEHVDPVFYGDPKTAAMKVLGNL
jgi:hypothetical protein